MINTKQIHRASEATPQHSSVTLPAAETHSKHVKTAVCSWCGQRRSISDLNGWDPITGNTESAHCIEISTCQSTEAAEIIDTVLADACPDDSGSDQAEQPERTDTDPGTADGDESHCSDCLPAETQGGPER